MGNLARFIHFYTDPDDGNSGPSDPLNTFTGSIVRFKSLKELPVVNLTANIDSVQSGTGDPSPDNVRPIRGWTGCNVTRTGANIFGDVALKDGIVAALPSATVDTGNKTVAFSANAQTANRNDITKGVSFKQNTRYSIIITASKNSVPSTINLRVYYTDGTYKNLDGVSAANTKEKSVTWTDEGKTVRSISKLNGGGITTIYYEESGIFEGTLTDEDFVPYTGTTIPITFPAEAGTVYGGTLDVTTGVLTVTHTAVDLGDLSWSRDTTTFSYPVFRSGNLSKVSTPIGADNLLCTCFKVVAIGTQLTSQNTIAPWDATTATYVGVRNDDYTDADAFKESVTGQMLRYKFKNPVTYQLTPQTVKTLVGINNIWADTGDVSVTAYGEPILTAQANTLLGVGLLNNAAVAEPESDEEYSEI